MKKLIPFAVVVFALLTSVACAAPISTYPAATTPLGGSEGMIGTQSGSTVQITPNMIGTYAPTISYSSATTPLTGSETLVGRQSGATVQITTGNIAALGAVAGGGYPCTACDYTGVTDSSTALQAVITAIGATPSGCGVITLNAGTLKIGTVITLPACDSLIGRGAQPTVLKASGSNRVLIWNGGLPANGSGLVANLTIDGNSTGLDGIVVGAGDNFRIQQVNVQNFTANACVFVTTQNMVADQLQCQNSATNFLLTSGVWNSTFNRWESNNASVHNIYSKRDTSYETLLSVTATGDGNNFRNLFIHGIAERGTPTDALNLTDDDGQDTFLANQWVIGSSGNPAVVVGLNASNTTFINDLFQNSLNGETFAIDNTAFGTVLQDPLFASWTGSSPINNNGSGTVSIRDPGGGPFSPIVAGVTGRDSLLTDDFTGGQMMVSLGGAIGGSPDFFGLGRRSVMLADMLPKQDVTQSIGGAGLTLNAIWVGGGPIKVPIDAGVHTVTSGEALAGTVSITTHLANGIGQNVQITRSGITITDTFAPFLSGGVLQISNVGGHYTMMDGDIINWLAIGP